MYRHIFGPVPSRRLGMSLGVDLVPHKVCSLDCVYCESGATKKLTLERKEYVPFDIVVSELQDFFHTYDPPDFATFSGSGEPTLNSRIGDVLSFVKKTAPKVSTAVITNGTLLWMPEVRNEILTADVVLPSFDARFVDDFQKVNRPATDLDLEKYFKGLIDFRKEFNGQIWLEILIIPEYNDSEKNIEQLKDAIIQINPDKVQLNTLDRPGVVQGIRAATYAEMNFILKKWNLSNVEIVASMPKRKDLFSFRQDIENTILETILRRPCTIDDLQQITGISISDLNKFLAVLEMEHKIKTEKQERGFFYLIDN